jgi:hypothetical protein
MKSTCCLVLPLALLSVGCGPILTKPQVTAVSDFGTAAKNYSALPGSVLRAYEEVHSADTLFTASTAEGKDAVMSLAVVKRSLATGDELGGKAAQLDKAVSVLTTYSEALTQLVSDDQLKALDSNADDLGKALDGSIAEYNKLPHVTQTIHPFGAATAAAVRGLGGIGIRVKQAKYLQRFVEEADPMVQKLAKDLAGLMQELGSEETGCVCFSAEKVKLEANFISYFSLRPGFMNHGDIEAFASWMAKAEAGKKLATMVDASTTRLGKAHTALVAAIKPDGSPKGRLEELRSLSEQIKAAQALQKKLESN